MHHTPAKASTSVSVLLVSALLLLACAQRGAPVASVSIGPPDTLNIHMATKSSPIEADHHLTVSVSCQPGEQMLGGGYAAMSVFESDFTLLAFYPSTTTTWTMSADSGSTYQLQAFVYCLTSSPSLGIRIHQASECPMGTARLSSGFQGATHYVVCSSRNATETGDGFRIGSLAVVCVDQATGTSLSESRTFAYACAAHHAAV